MIYRACSPKLNRIELLLIGPTSLSQHSTVNLTFFEVTTRHKMTFFYPSNLQQVEARLIYLTTKCQGENVQV